MRNTARKWVDGPPIAQVEIPDGNEWNTITANLSALKVGVHNLVVSLTGNKSVEVDWLKFESNFRENIVG